MPSFILLIVHLIIMLRRFAFVSFRASNNKGDSSVNQRQMNLFNKLTGWWHPSGPSQILYLYNYHRISFLRKFITPKSHTCPLQNMDVLDVGCGAGFLSQSLARLGANVTALDPNLTSFTQAQNHKANRLDLSRLNYFNMSLQQFINNKVNPTDSSHSKMGQQSLKFDIVTSMQVVEHVNNPQQFVKQLSSCARQGGLVMLSTIRRSTLSWLTHIVLAQGVFGIVPKGTHHHNQFINPSQCVRMLQNSGVQTLDILQLQLNWKGQLQPKVGGSNYLIIGKKIQKAVKSDP